MYIFIFEDGEVKVSATCDDGDMSACDDGLLDVIDASGDIPIQYYDGGWQELESVDND